MILMVFAAEQGGSVGFWAIRTPSGLGRGSLASDVPRMHGSMITCFALPFHFLADPNARFGVAPLVPAYNEQAERFEPVCFP